MGYGIRLTDVQWNELDCLRLTHPCKVVYRNCLIIVLSNSRQTIAAIARQLGCATDTVARMRRLYRNGGPAAMIPGKSPGRPCRATAVYRKALRRAVQISPLKLGYGFTTWSAKRLAQHLARQTGIHYSDDQIRRILHQEGFSLRSGEQRTLMPTASASPGSITAMISSMSPWTLGTKWEPDSVIGIRS